MVENDALLLIEPIDAAIREARALNQITPLRIASQLLGVYPFCGLSLWDMAMLVQWRLEILQRDERTTPA